MLWNGNWNAIALPGEFLEVNIEEDGSGSGAVSPQSLWLYIET